MYYQHVTFYAGGIYIDQPNAALRIIYYHPRRAYDLNSRSGLPWAPRETEWFVGGAKCRICWNYAFSTARQLLVAKSDIGFFNLPSHMGEKKIEHCIRDPRFHNLKKSRQSFDVSDIDLYQTIKINTVVINSRNVVDNLAGLGFESILKRGGWKSDRRPGTIRVPLAYPSPGGHFFICITLIDDEFLLSYWKLPRQVFDRW
ncbi:hypothetical protein GEV33_005594 [Tenebrio molitor]|uniref:Uncharacterized protein n=1 Tax=Tenebrio molitor TaxID=7067 RepID=A0A8J6HMW8_TENMO|nr:hypothetical protein GEV33_005594 [Tenebrio molitor]